MPLIVQKKKKMLRKRLMMASTKNMAIRMRLGPSPNDMYENLSKSIEPKMAVKGAESRLESCLLNSGSCRVVDDSVVDVRLILAGCSHSE